MSEKPSHAFPTFAAVAARLPARLDEIVEAMLQRVWANPALADWTRDEARDSARAIARASIENELRALAAGELPESCPEEDLATAHAAVAYGAPVTVVLHCYRAGQAAIWDAWLDEVDRLGPGADDRRRLLDAGGRFLNEYVDRCAAWVELEHSRERERLIRSEEQRRMSVVRDLLDGLPADTDALDYDLDREHTALIVQGPRAEAGAAALCERAGEDPLSLSVDPVTWWLWVPGDLDLDGYEPAPGARLAVGGPAPGPDGFRRAHADARAAARVAAHRPQPVLHYRDVALEALAGQDERRARDFIEHELGPLLAEAAGGGALVETLEAYYAAGQNAVSAAAILGVSDRTIANRLHRVEEVLGTGTIVDRRAEIETALRLSRLLAAEPASG